MTGATMPNYTPALVTGGVPQTSAYKEGVASANRQNMLVNAVGGSKRLYKKKSNRKKTIRMRSARLSKRTKRMRRTRVNRRTRRRRMHKGGAQAFVYTSGTPQQRAIQGGLAQNQVDLRPSSAGAPLVRPSI